MASLANNSNIVAYLFTDPTASACLSTYGGATAVCNAFGGTAYVNYILQPGKTCSSFADINIGPYAFTNPVSANTFVRNVCAYSALVNLPACGSGLTSCTFTCFAASTYGLPCIAAEYTSGNTGFFTQLFNLNSCAQLASMVFNNSFISAYYKASFNEKFNCFWQKCNRSTCTALYTAPTACSISIASGVRNPCLECCMTPSEASYYTCAWCYFRNPISVSNNGNFIMIGGGFTGTGLGCNAVYHPQNICVDGVNYCTALHDTVKSSGFCVCCPAVMYSSDNGCTFNKPSGFCIPSTFFTCVCCDGFLYMSGTAGQNGCVEIQWGLGSFTCEGSIWQGFRINNLCCKSHGVWGYACATVLANNTPGAWTVCLGSFPFLFTTFCCGYFSGIGGDCCTNTFTSTRSPSTSYPAQYNNASGTVCHYGVHTPRFVIGKMTGSANTCAFSIAQQSCTLNCVYYHQCVISPLTNCAYFCGTLCGTSGFCCCDRPQDNPFCRSVFVQLQSCINYGPRYPTISFMTCVSGNTNNIRAWLLQLNDNTTLYYPSAGYTCHHSSCTLVEWNAGAPNYCALTGASFASGGSFGVAMSGVVPIANTIMIVAAPYITECSTEASGVPSISRSCSLCCPGALHGNIQTSTTCYSPTFSCQCKRFGMGCCLNPALRVICSNFSWGSSPFNPPDDYGCSLPTQGISAYYAAIDITNSYCYAQYYFYGPGQSANYYPYPLLCAPLCSCGCVVFAPGIGYPMVDGSSHSSANPICVCLCGRGSGTVGPAGYGTYKVSGGVLCDEGTLDGLIMQINPSSNTFVAIAPFGDGPQCGCAYTLASYSPITVACTNLLHNGGSSQRPGSILYNYPTDGSNANTIYGRMDCANAVRTALGNNQKLHVNRLFCNIGYTDSFETGTFAYANNYINPSWITNNVFLDDKIPGCPKPAFCCSFNWIISTDSTQNPGQIAGWSSPIVYGGNALWPWGANTANASSTSLSTLSCIGNASYLGSGRCIYRGGSYGWSKASIDCSFFCVYAYGSSQCIATPNIRFVCTANGMPGIVFGGTVTGSAFFANGQPYTTCTMKLRFIDMF
jgi:hypothetical protein